jgi:hypothetical protein
MQNSPIDKGGEDDPLRHRRIRPKVSAHRRRSLFAISTDLSTA